MNLLLWDMGLVIQLLNIHSSQKGSSKQSKKIQPHLLGQNKARTVFYIHHFTCINFIIEEVQVWREAEHRVKVGIHRLNLTRTRGQVCWDRWRISRGKKYRNLRMFDIKNYNIFMMDVKYERISYIYVLTIIINTLQIMKTETLYNIISDIKVSRVKVNRFLTPSSNNLPWTTS